MGPLLFVVNDSASEATSALRANSLWAYRPRAYQMEALRCATLGRNLWRWQGRPMTN